MVDADDLHFDRITDRDHFAWVVDALVAHVGDMEQAIDAAQINERTVVGDVLDHAVNNLVFLEVQDQARTLLGAGFFQNSAARNHDVAPAAIHFQDLEWLRNVHQRANIAHWADIDLAAGKKRHCAIEINGEAAFDAAKDHAVDALAFAKFAFQLVPRGFAAGAVAAKHGFAV